MRRLITELSFEEGEAYIHTVSSRNDIPGCQNYFDQLITLCNQSDEGRLVIGRDVEQLVARGGSTFFLISLGSNLIGLTTLVLVDTIYGRHGIICGTVVDQRYRRSRLGHILTEEARSVGREARCRWVEIVISHESEGTQIFCPVAGFEQVSLANAKSPRAVDVYRDHLRPSRMNGK